MSEKIPYCPSQTKSLMVNFFPVFSRPHIKHIIMAYGVDVPTEVGYEYHKKVPLNDDEGGAKKKEEKKSSGKKQADCWWKS